MSTQRTVIRNGHVLTMDPDLGDLPGAEVLIEDGQIVAVGPTLGVDDAEVIDATGRLVLPGLIDTHRHTWQSLMRGVCGDWTLADYYFGMRLGISPAYRPDDLRLGNFYGGVDALNAGVTTLLDFSHCNNTPEHSDAAVRGLQEAGVRAAFCYGFFESSPESPRFGTHADRIADYHRIADTYFASDGLLSLGVSLSELFGLPWEDTVGELAAARERRALLANHAGCVFGSVLATGITEMEGLGLLGPDMVHVHCNSFGDEEWGGGGGAQRREGVDLGRDRAQHGFRGPRVRPVRPVRAGADVVGGRGLPEQRRPVARDAVRDRDRPGSGRVADQPQRRDDRRGRHLLPGGRRVGHGERRRGPRARRPGRDPDTGQARRRDRRGRPGPRTAPAGRPVRVVGVPDDRGGCADGPGGRPCREARRCPDRDRPQRRIRDAGRDLPGTPQGAWAAIEPMARGFHGQAVRAVEER